MPPRQAAPEERVVFGIAAGEDDDNIPVVVLGVPTAAWNYMSEGLTHNFDLTKAGIPIKIMLFGGKDQQAVLNDLNRGNVARGYDPVAPTGEDYTINPLQTTEDRIKAVLDLMEGQNWADRPLTDEDKVLIDLAVRATMSLKGS